MLYLAQVNKNPLSGQIELQFLARQQSELIWQVENCQSIPLIEERFCKEGLLVLVKLDNNQEILSIEEAKDWILNLIQKYYTEGAITPDFVQQEEARVEQWRQEITVQSLELTRKHLEIETQRDQLQELENSLKQEKEKLDRQRKELEIEREALKTAQQARIKNSQG